MKSAADDESLLAHRIQTAGWRQCSVFQPGLIDRKFLPAYLELKEDELLLVCTQSCSVCADNFGSEPQVEVMLCSPMERYNSNHNDAKGRSSHTLHLPIGGLPNIQALSCKLGRRAFIPRRLLHNLKPEKTWITEESLNSFKGWLSNYYVRIALPDELVKRLRSPAGVSEIVKSALLQEVGGRKIDELVESFWVRWSTDDELVAEKFYEISLVVVCEDEQTKEYLDRALAPLIGTERSPLSVHGIIVNNLVVEPADNVTLRDLSGMSRFTEWDNLSALTERLVSIRATS